jgi:hypothetical protein
MIPQYRFAHQILSRPVLSEHNYHRNLSIDNHAEKNLFLYLETSSILCRYGR